MKFRSGFVSNSSSSSFVLLGANVKLMNLSEEEKKKIMDSHGASYNEYIEDSFYEFLYSISFGLDYIDLEGEAVIGKRIAYSSDYMLNESVTDLNDLISMAQEVKLKIKEVFGIDIDIKLFTGEAPS